VSDTPKRGDILLVRLPVHAPPGHEQQGLRPVLLLAEPERAGTPRFEVVFGAPLTSHIDAWTKIDPNLYLVLPKGTGGLTRDSAVLIEHARGIDATRVVRRLGKLTYDEYVPIRRVVRKMFGK
jgi:mRNA interferase MazF